MALQNEGGTTPHYDRERAFWDRTGNTAFSVLSRHDLPHVLNWIDWHGGGRVLELGGGAGILGRHLSEAADTWCVCLDISAQMLRHADAARVQSDALHLPFRDGSFSLIIAAALFHHLPGKEIELLKECRRVLSPGGRVVGYDPNAHSLQNRLFMTSGPLRLTSFSPDERPIAPESLGAAAVTAALHGYRYQSFSFRYERVTAFELVQRFVLNPMSKIGLARYLDRWFFWEATKSGSASDAAIGRP